MTILLRHTHEAAPLVLVGVDAPLQWDKRQNRIMESIWFGIEQARMNMGTVQTDADLTTDDDEEE